MIFLKYIKDKVEVSLIYVISRVKKDKLSIWSKQLVETLFLVSGQVILRGGKAEVALGVDAVVVDPVRHRGHADPALNNQYFRGFSQILIFNFTIISSFFAREA